MDYVKKSDNSLVVMQNGKIIEADKIQSYENTREKRIRGIHNGKPFMYIQKKPKFSLFPKKHVTFRKMSPLQKMSYRYNCRTPTPYPRDIQTRKPKHTSLKKKQNNKTKNNKK
jgi:hypothetical protein